MCFQDQKTTFRGHSTISEFEPSVLLSAFSTQPSGKLKALSQSKGSQSNRYGEGSLFRFVPVVPESS
jgi:hypothetical protein